MSVPNDPKSSTPSGNGLLTRKPKIINVGLDGFADELAQQGVAVVRVAWTPPAGGDAKLARLLAKLGV
ncbi:MAG: hypothetical protein ACRCTD_05950 [Beijerinckiaceae bacterium]